MTDKEIKEYMELIEGQAQAILDHLAEMAAVLTVGTGSDTAHPAKRRPSERTVAHSGGTSICV